jgi:acyl-CoA thioester hydrolase
VNTWECDEMGHMNVRFYLGKAHQGLIQLGAMVGLGPRALAELGSGAGADLVTRRQHIRFLRELHAGADVSIEGGFVDVGKSGFTLFQEMLPLAASHVSATLISQVELVDLKNGALIDIPSSAVEKMMLIESDIPDYGQPKSLSFDRALPMINNKEGLAEGRLVVSAEVVRSDQVDRNGNLYPDQFIGHISDGIGNLFGLITKDDVDIYERTDKTGGAALEYLFEFLGKPREGDIIKVLSAPQELQAKVYSLSHAIVDGETGEPLAAASSVHIAFDLKTRKSIPVPERLKKGLEAYLLR